MTDSNKDYQRDLDAKIAAEQKPDEKVDTYNATAGKLKQNLNDQEKIAAVKNHTGKHDKPPASDLPSPKDVAHRGEVVPIGSSIPGVLAPSVEGTCQDPNYGK